MNVQNQTGIGPWSRADKINRWIAVLALVAAFIALVPYVQHGVDWLRKSSATFTPPTDCSTFSISHNQGATGVARNIPINSDLWLALRAGAEGRWYPVAWIPSRNGPWTVPPQYVTPALGRQELALIIVPVTDDAQFIDYVKLKHQTGADPGISSLPPLAELKTICQIEVKP